MKKFLLLASMATLAATTAYASAPVTATTATVVPVAPATSTSTTNNTVGGTDTTTTATTATAADGSTLSTTTTTTMLDPTGATGWYINGFGGATDTNQAKLKGQGDYSDIDPTLEYQQPGWDLGAAAGYKYQNWRGEFQVNYMSSNVNKLKGSDDGGQSVSISGNGSTNVWSGMLNGYYDIDTDSKFVPYVGLGMGYANVNYNTDPKDDVGHAEKLTGSDGVFAYQGILGLGFQLNQNSRISAEYRYFSTAKGSYSGKIAGQSVKFNNTYTNNLFNIGYTYMFGA